MTSSSFNVEKKFKLLTLAGFIFFASMFFLVTYLLIFPDEELHNGKLIVYGIILALFGLLALYGFITFKNFYKHAISIDANGIWYSCLPKESGLVKWTQVKGFKEYSYWQKLRLLDKQGECLIDIHFQLKDFNKLRKEVIERVEPNFRESSPFDLRASIFFHIYWAGLFVGFLCLSYWSIKNYSEIMGAVIILISLGSLYVYLTSYSKLSFGSKEIKATSLFKSTIYKYDDIKDVLILDDYHQGNRNMEVVIDMENEERLQIPKMNSSTLDIYFKLKLLMDNRDNHYI